MIEQYINDFNAALVANIGNKLEYLIKGIAEPVYVMDNEEKVFPAIIENGEDQYPFIDDEYHFGIYHKVNKKTYTNEPAKGFGDEPKIKATVDCSLIGWGFLSTLTANELESFIIANSPTDIIIVSTDFDKKRVFNSEFAKIDFFIPETCFLFKMEYRVTYTVNKKCIEINQIFN